MKSSAPKFPLISNGKINEDILELIALLPPAKN